MPVNIVTITTLNRMRFYSGQPGTSEGTVYTASGGTTVKVSDVILANTTATAARVSLSVVPVSGSAGATNRLFHNVTVPAGGVVSLDIAVYMDAGEFLSAVQDTSGAITMTISGEIYA